MSTGKSWSFFDRSSNFDRIKGGMMNNDYWFSRLADEPTLKTWIEALRREEPEWFSERSRGDVGKWQRALQELPAVAERGFSVELGMLRFPGSEGIETDLLMSFHPWRKGPVAIGDTIIDTEWRSDWKWERLAPHIDLQGKTVLDIGCGNGYYLWRMLEAGAQWALGIDPYIPYVMQFQCLRHFGGAEDRAHIFPIGVESLPAVAPCFQVVFSMGVLYHQRSPLQHLAHCRDLTVKGGEVIIETIVMPDSYDKVTDCLVPEGRYAKMKNVHFIPSVPMLVSWLRKARFSHVEVIDVAKTTLQEQRSTDWMTFDSLPDFLDQDDVNVTVEGHPAPWRAVIKAVK